jgi:hypothetical protein
MRALLLLSLCALSSAWGNQQIAELRDQLDDAFIRGDGERMAVLADRFADEKGALAAYYAAYAHYRLGELYFEDKKRGKQHLNECIDLLKPVVKSDASFADAHALLATCYGVSAPFYMLRAATRGMAANGELEKALAADPDSPRVILAEGISLYFRPSAFGGDKERAKQRIAEALESFNSYQPARDDGPVWGEAEAWLYLARIARDEGNEAVALESFGRSLSTAPYFKAAQTEFADYLGGL